MGRTCLCYSYRKPLRLLRMRRCCAFGFPIASPSCSYSCDMNKVLPGLISGEPVFLGGYFYLFLHCLVCCIVRSSPPRGARRRCYSPWINFIMMRSIISFAFCPSVFFSWVFFSCFSHALMHYSRFSYFFYFVMCRSCWARI